jgi:hypothetical protein
MIDNHLAEESVTLFVDPDDEHVACCVSLLHQWHQLSDLINQSSISQQPQA